MQGTAAIAGGAALTRCITRMGIWHIMRLGDRYPSGGHFHTMCTTGHVECSDWVCLPCLPCRRLGLRWFGAQVHKSRPVEELDPPALQRELLNQITCGRAPRTC